MLNNKSELLKIQQICLILLTIVTVSYSNITLELSSTMEMNRVNGQIVAVGTVDEEVYLVATVKSNKEINIRNVFPKLAESPNYTVRGVTRPQRGESAQFIRDNNRMVSKRTISYTYHFPITLKKTGRFVINPVTITIDGKEYRSEKLTVMVNKSSSGNMKVLFKIKTPQELYRGGQYTITLEVYEPTNAPIQVDWNSHTRPAILNFMQALEKDVVLIPLWDNPVVSNKIIDGDVYKVSGYPFSAVPLKNGTVTIPSLRLQYYELVESRRRQRSRSLFDDMFSMSMGQQARVKSTSTKKINLSVRELPPSPQNFTGTVGAVTMKTRLSSTTVKAGESLTLFVDLRGNVAREGNLQDVDLSHIKNAEIFPPEKTVTIDTTIHGVVSEKKLKYLVIPQREGQFTIPSIQYTYFDIEKNSYETISSEPMVVNVGKGKVHRQTTVGNTVTKEEIKTVGQDIRYIKTEASLTHEELKPYTKKIFYIVYPVPFLLALFFGLYQVQRKRGGKDPKIAKRKQAYSNAQKNLSILRKSSDSDIIKEITAVITNYINDKFAFTITGLTQEELKHKLHEVSLDEQSITSLLQFREELEGYRFGGGVMTDANKEKLIAQVETIIKGIEKE